MSEYNSLDEALAALPRDAEPRRDLWPEIRSTIVADLRASRRSSEQSANGSRFFSGWVQLAAGLVLMVVTATTTYVVTRESVTQEMHAKSLNFDVSALGPNYGRARADLERLYQERIAQLPPDTRARLESNLADLRRAADDIAVTLAQHPSDSLLQELLVSTRRRELQLLADVSQMNIPNT